MGWRLFRLSLYVSGSVLLYSLNSRAPTRTSCRSCCWYEFRSFAVEPVWTLKLQSGCCGWGMVCGCCIILKEWRAAGGSGAGVMRGVQQE